MARLITSPSFFCLYDMLSPGKQKLWGVTGVNKTLKSLVVLCVVTTLFGCASRRAFTTSAQAGDTVILGIGWHPEVRRNDLTLTLTDAMGNEAIYLPGDPAVRAVVNLYPDPVSSFIVDTELGVNPVAQDTGILHLAVTNGNKEYSEKFVLIDLPTTLSTGQTNIDITSATGDVIKPLRVEILPGLGSPNVLGNYNGWSVDDSNLQYMERAPYYAVGFSGSTIPHAIQIDITHNPDSNNGGTGTAFVTAARADMKSIAWSDNGTDLLRVILTPSGAALDDMQHFRFYVAGGLTGLLENGVTAFDINGVPVPGISANITANP